MKRFSIALATICIVLILIFTTSRKESSNFQSSITELGKCTPARILYYNLQPSLYSRSGELPEFKEVKESGFDITLKNRISTEVIVNSTLEPYNVLWLHNGCGGETFPLKNSEIAAIKDFYLKGGSLILDAGDDKGGGLYGPSGSDCQSRVNQIAENLGVTFLGQIAYAPTVDNCRPIQGGGHPILEKITRIFRESSGELKLLDTVLWGKSKPVLVGKIDSNSQPVLATITKEGSHGGVIFSPQDQGFLSQCTGQDGVIYKNIFSFLGHPLDCAVSPEQKTTSTFIAGGTCQRVEKSLYGSGSIKVPCPSGTVIMGGGWDNGAGEKFNESRPFEVGNGWQCHGNLETATGICAAVCCDASLYESIVIQSPGQLSDRREPLCPGNYKVVGGGFVDTTLGKDEDILAPNDRNGWVCFDDDSKNLTGSQCFAVCANRKTATDILTCQTKSLLAPQGTATGVIISCPEGTFVTGGGFEDRTDSNHDQDVSMPTPDGTGWVCRKEGNSKLADANICYARCCTLPANLLDYALSSSSSFRSSSLSYTSQFSIDFSSSISSAVTVLSSAPSSDVAIVSQSSSASSIRSSTFSSFFSSVPVVKSSPVSIALASSPMSRSSLHAQSSIQSSNSSLSIQISQCPQNACLTIGEQYCASLGLGCGAIATDPCFVCLAVAPQSSARSILPSSQRAFLADSSSSPSSARKSSAQLQLVNVSSTTPLTALLTPLSGIQESPHTAAHPPVGKTGPGTLAAMAAGSAAGIAYMRKRRTQK